MVVPQPIVIEGTFFFTLSRLKCHGFGEHAYFSPTSPRRTVYPFLWFHSQGPEGWMIIFNLLSSNTVVSAYSSGLSETCGTGP